MAEVIDMVPRGAPQTTFTLEQMERLEQDYRMGEKSMPKIASEYGIHERTLRRMAEKFGWVRNLRGRVARHVYDKLHGAEPMDRPTFTKEEAAVEHAAVNAVTMIQEHMQTAHAVFQLTGIAAQQLEDAMGRRHEIEELIREETPDADGRPGRAQAVAAKKRDAMMRAVSLPTHVATLKDLAIAMKAVVELSRVLMGIHDSPPPPPEDSKAMTVADERIEELRARLRLSFKQSKAIS